MRFRFYLFITGIFLVRLTSSCYSTNKTAGEELCIDPAKINPDGICIMVYDPVCGCDGKTYGNECEAANAGVQKFTKGACDDK